MRNSIKNAFSTIGSFFTPLYDFAESLTDFDFPKVTFNDQKLLHEYFLKFIEKESNSKVMKQFADSHIDIERLESFGSLIQRADPAQKIFNVLSIDLGGSSLKITNVEINYSSYPHNIPKFKTLCSSYFLYSDENPEYLSTLKWSDWIAEKVKIYLEKNNLHSVFLSKGAPMPASFTFSFKLHQTSLLNATVEACSKEFKFSKKDLFNEDVVESLNKSLERSNINIKVNCVLNDVVASYATAVAKKYINPVSFIIGTGTNAGFRIERDGKNTIINSEWGFTPVDDKFIDVATKKVLQELNKGYLLFEVLVAGFKFEEIIKKMVSLQIKDQKLIDKIDLKFIRAIFYDEFDDDEYKNDFINFTTANRKFASAVKKSIVCFKNRAYKIVAPLLVAASGHKNFSLLANGSIITNKKDVNLLVEEIESFIKKSKIPIRYIKIGCDNNASLYGAAFVSLVFNSETMKNM